jgi:hypothetical protein
LPFLDLIGRKVLVSRKSRTDKRLRFQIATTTRKKTSSQQTHKRAIIIFVRNSIEMKSRRSAKRKKKEVEMITRASLNEISVDCNETKANHDARTDDDVMI